MPFATDMRKTELFQSVERHKRPEKTFRNDKVLKFHGHDVLRLPPYKVCATLVKLSMLGKSKKTEKGK
jgi:hypothetical protein